jgi:hypothetical protein
MATFYAYREGQKLVPRSLAAALEIERLPVETALRVKAVKPRSGKYHRLILGLCSLVAEALNNGPSKTIEPWDTESVLRNIKVALGDVEIAPMTARQKAKFGIPADEKAYIAVTGSISYRSRDQKAFDEWSEKAMEYIANDLCPYIQESPEWVQIANILMMMDKLEAAK